MGEGIGVGFEDAMEQAAREFKNLSRKLALQI